ncbi:hypothetical protein [Amycolatopsis vastitatis]|uniref:Uncharacterized protein n=1 Tax=Amycolatopsis vastitatis TaxID=1905142 RepID=A0A229SU21_9PSEU|nr:hypothetical protein [Amycolatopsis vastitatis]OXM62124.1 hypothetical protein CF165_35830 [Amycolatopsis vastitatis]
MGGPGDESRDGTWSSAPRDVLVLAHTGTSGHPSDVSVAKVDAWLLGGLPAVLLPAVVAAVWSRRTARAVSGTPGRKTHGGG